VLYPENHVYKASILNEIEAENAFKEYETWLFSADQNELA
jgi:hypothetical protein